MKIFEIVQIQGILSQGTEKNIFSSFISTTSFQIQVFCLNVIFNLSYHPMEVEKIVAQE